MQPRARDGLSSAPRLLVWFVLAAIVPACALVGLGWAVVRNDRRQAREQAAELAATALQRTLAQLEEQVSTFSLGQSIQPGIFNEDVAIATFGRAELLARACLLLPFYPVAVRAESPRPEIFAQADRLEFEQNDRVAALRLLDPLTRAADPAIRAEALLRAGGLRRRIGDVAGAIDVFERLAALDTTVVDGQPAGLTGGQARALILAALGRRTDLERTAADLQRDVVRGRWPLLRPQYEFALRQTREWLGTGEQAAVDERAALAAAAERVWTDWQTAARDVSVTRSRTTLWAGDRSVLVLTRGSPGTLTVLLAGPGFLEKHWRSEVLAAGSLQDVDLALTDADGRAVVGDPRLPLDRQSVRPASVTNLPWTVHAIARDGATSPSLSGQALLLLSGIGVTMLVVATGGYFISRALARELRVARLQSDFVSAVSHEFRTPLTTVRQLSELLARGRVSTDERRAQFYDVLVRESERLHRLVESLLNFARLEAGELEYRFETVAPGPFLRDLVRNAQSENLGSGVQIEVAGDQAPLPPIRADRDLLALVFANLLDNALKYSGDSRHVRVDIDRAGDRFVVRVRDRGMGIPASEQRDIFRKFVRGAAAKTASIRGTGIGLAMAREIVRAHGGEIAVESEVGVGSTFTVTLPLAPVAERDASAARSRESQGRLTTITDHRQ